MSEKINTNTLTSYGIQVQKHLDMVNNLVQKKYDENIPDIFECPKFENNLRLNQLLRSKKNKHINVVELATGSNFTTPYTLSKNCYDFLYIAFDVYPKLLNLNINAIKEACINGSIYHIIASATNLPLPNDFADIVIYLHAINDIWFTVGMSGVKDSISESLRILKPDGIIISVDSYMDVDPTTNFVSHNDFKNCLNDFCRYELKEYDNDISGKGWLLVYNVLF